MKQPIRLRLMVTVLILFLSQLVFSATRVYAAGEVSQITALTTFGCSPYTAHFNWQMTGSGGTTYRINLVVQANGQTIMNENDGIFVGSTVDHYTTYYTSSYGPAVNNWPLAPHTIETVIMNMRLNSTQAIVAQGIISFDCTTGQIIKGG